MCDGKQPVQVCIPLSWASTLQAPSAIAVHSPAGTYICLDLGAHFNLVCGIEQASPILECKLTVSMILISLDRGICPRIENWSLHELVLTTDNTTKYD